MKDKILIILGIVLVIAAVARYCVCELSCELPIVYRGFQKYGVVMSAADVLKLEALEKNSNGK
jgi:hypothetical protein